MAPTQSIGFDIAMSDLRWLEAGASDKPQREREVVLVPKLGDDLHGSVMMVVSDDGNKLVHH